MARRRGKTSVLDDLMELLAWLPWWVGVLLAIAGYVVLHRLANAPLPVAGTPQDIAHMAAHGIWQGLAHAGQFIVPLICAMGALASAMRRRERRLLIDTACRSTAADALHGMDWKEFERLVGEGFRRQGYLVAETGGGGADGGVDLALGKAGEKFLVQCKQWKAFKVGVAVVRELYGVMAARGAAGGFVVTSGSFTQEATEFASGRNIQLIDGPALLRLIRQGRSAPEPRTEPQPQARMQAQPAEKPAGNGPAHDPDPASEVEAPPACPVCAQPMVRRVARRGASAGQGFWGCSGYPRCRGTRPL